MAADIAGKVVLITGASTGIGAAAAKTFFGLLADKPNDMGFIAGFALSSIGGSEDKLFGSSAVADVGGEPSSSDRGGVKGLSASGTFFAAKFRTIFSPPRR